MDEKLHREIITGPAADEICGILKVKGPLYIFGKPSVVVMDAAGKFIELSDVNDPNSFEPSPDAAPKK